MTGSKRSHVSSSSSESMVIKQRTACEFKKKLMDLTNQKKKNGGYVSKVKDRPIICEPSSSAMDQAQAIQANLSPKFPSFLKLLVKSHVTGRFRLYLPRLFCDAHLHLPKEEGTIVLLDDNDREYNASYLVEKKGVGCRLRSFSTAHKLLEGDVLVFCLIEPCKFKIYIAKAKRLIEVDGAATMTPPNQDFRDNPTEEVKTEPKEETTDITETTRDKYLEYLTQKTERSSEYSPPSFKDVKGFKDFSIYVDGLIIDSEIPTDCKAKYYELCKSQNMFLHENLLQGLNGKLAAEMISETIKIADASGAVDFRTGVDIMEGWDKTLKAFEELGMVVGFLRVRINELLISKARENRATIIRLKRIERDGAEQDMRALNVKLSKIKSRIKKIDAEIDALLILHQ